MLDLHLGGYFGGLGEFQSN